MRMLCNTCLVDKSESEFHRTVTYKCKACINEYAREWRKRFPEKAAIREAKKREARRPRQKVLRKLYYLKHGQTRSPNYIEVNKKWRDAHREERNASARLLYAVKSGLVLRPKHCEVCNAECKPNGHHFDYGRTLDVIWLCASCHRENHSHLPREIKTKVAELVRIKFPPIVCSTPN